jgi:hypothetical protein
MSSKSRYRPPRPAAAEPSGVQSLGAASKSSIVVGLVILLIANMIPVGDGKGPLLVIGEILALGGIAGTLIAIALRAMSHER